MANHFAAVILGCLFVGSLGAGEDELTSVEISSELSETLSMALQHELERVQLELKICADNVKTLYASHCKKNDKARDRYFALNGDGFFEYKNRLVTLLDSIKDSEEDADTYLFKAICSYYDNVLIGNLIDALHCKALWDGADLEYSPEEGMQFLIALKELFASESKGGMPERRLERATMVINLLLAKNDKECENDGVMVLDIQSQCVPFARYDQRNFRKIPEIQGGFAILKEYTHHHVKSWSFPGLT